MRIAVIIALLIAFCVYAFVETRKGREAFRQQQYKDQVQGQYEEVKHRIHYDVSGNYLVFEPKDSKEK